MLYLITLEFLWRYTVLTLTLTIFGILITPLALTFKPHLQRVPYINTRLSSGRQEANRTTTQPRYKANRATTQPRYETFGDLQVEISIKNSVINIGLVRFLP